MDVGESSTLIAFDILGSANPLEVRALLVGEGPVVSVLPESLDWGLQTVLKACDKTVVLHNESTIEAPFACTFACTDTVFRVEPAEGVIAPGQDVSVTLSTHLDDTLLFR